MNDTRKISALIKNPGMPPRHVWISNSLKALQNNVDGYIETVTLIEPYDGNPGLVVIANEEGIPLGLEYNTDIYGYKLYGTIIMCGVEGDEFTDLPLEWPEMKILFPMLWEVRA